MLTVVLIAKGTSLESTGNILSDVLLLNFLNYAPIVELHKLGLVQLASTYDH
jgi:hypothetical protein